MRRIAFIAIILLSLPCWAQYSIKYIDCPGADLTRLFGINNSGLMVGSYRPVPGMAQHAMIYKNGKCQGLEEVFGAYSSLAYGVNDSGAITGVYADENGTHGFVLKNGNLASLDYPGSEQTVPRAISNSGVVVGFYISSDDFLMHGFTYADGNFQPLDVPFAGTVDTLPFGINARGDVVGDWDTDPTTIGHGFIRRNNGVESFDFPEAPENGTFLTGINDRGDMCGYFGEMAGPVSGFVLLGSKPLAIPWAGDGMMIPQAINNKRIVVGNVSDANGRHGFIAIPNKLNVH